MSLYTRNIRPAFGMRQQVKIHKGEGLSIILKDNPLSHFYQSPVSDPKAKRISQTIYTYLAAVQMRQYNQVIELPKEAVQAHIKRALDKYSPEYVCRAIRYASMVGQHPYSISFALRVFDNVGKEFDIRSGADQKSNISATGTLSLWDHQ